MGIMGRTPFPVETRASKMLDRYENPREVLG